MHGSKRMNWRSLVPGSQKVPEKRVVTVRFWQAPLFVLVIAPVSFLLGLKLGQHLGAGSVRETNNEKTETTASLSRALQQSEARASLLAGELSEVQLQAGVGTGAAAELQASLSSQQHEIAALREEVLRYREILSPASVPAGVQISDFRIVQTEAVDVFSYEIRLSQTGAGNPKVRGALSLLIEADLAGDKVQLPVETLNPGVSNQLPIKIGFQHFQHVRGGLRLPPGHLPLRVIVKLTLAGGVKPLTRSFPWIVESL
jgi:hypothetical protein